ncbi:Pkinase-domain-containing protein [Rhizopus microsporus]|uniref:Pkinase-domain-containing protein n=1 Tax=Rhizopus microsporus TaxID=58291 RepID=A0A1X0S6Y3_RHIZD|nr:Pkinase-domain-containing protein [Rhizopus microsporus]
MEQNNIKRNQLPHNELDRFKLLKKIGDGAFSNVYAARDIVTGKKVAIKVAQKPKAGKNNGHRHLHSSIQKKPKATERASILKEVQIMRNVRHPNIVQLIHYTETKDSYLLTMELCEGGELFHQIVKLTYFSEELSRHVITQVAAAVKYLHEECGVVHRDIKPENILFDPIPIIPSKHRKLRPTDNESKMDEGEFIKGYGGGGIGRVKLADFGLSKVIWNNSTFTPCGTVGYTAPEIVCDQQYSKSVDMWAIGCVLYTILCGFPPFYDESIQSLTDKVAKGEFTFLSPWWDTIGLSVKDLIRHLLCVDSKKRLTIDEFFNHPWITEKEKDTKPSTGLQPSAREQIRLNQSHKYHPYCHGEQELTPLKDQENDAVMIEAPYSTPDAATLREIFDVTYAVQRMGEEQPDAKHHHHHKQAQQEQSLNKKVANKHVPVPQTQQNQHLPIAQKLAQHSRGVANPMHYQHQQQPYPHQSGASPAAVPTLALNGFKLDMNKATLLKNRKDMMKAQV